MSRAASASRPRTRPVFDHLARMTDTRGLFEHADHAIPRPEHGYCVDDVARGLVVVCREPDPDSVVLELASRYLDFVLAALAVDGTCHNRMDTEGAWRDQPALGDWWGRALWGLGAAATGAATPGMRARALIGFRRAARRRSPSARAMTFAALGAAELLRAAPDQLAARDLLQDCVLAIGSAGRDRSWPWPEGRLRYANGAVAEALILAGEVLHDRTTLEHGLRLLRFLLRIETRDGHLSVTPVGGRGQGDPSPGYDQQPIEVAAIADACASAYRVTGDPQWLAGINLGWRWYLGDNDAAAVMFDPMTGGGYDGLTPDGPNLNQGAESTLAFLSTAQHARDAHRLR
jgi:hypothetical protein